MKTLELIQELMLCDPQAKVSVLFFDDLDGSIVPIEIVGSDDADEGEVWLEYNESPRIPWEEDIE